MFLNCPLRLISGFILIVIFAGCNKESGDQRKNQSELLNLTTDYPRNQSLYIGGFQWGTPTSFNPLALTPAWPITGNNNLIYESMFGYDLRDGTLKGIIGSTYSLQGKIMSIHLREGVFWQNGDSLTSEDVIYTFNLHKNYLTNFSYAWNYITDVKSDGKYDVEITLNDKDFNPLVVEDLIAGLPILPAKIFKKIEDDAFQAVALETGAAPGNIDVIEKIREFTNDKHPVGSGPYTLEHYSDKAIVLKRLENYWGKTLHSGQLPSPQYIIHIAYPTNEQFNIALQKGDLDLSQTFFPQIWKFFKSGVGTWYSKEPYYIPGIIPALIMGLTRAPFDDVAFRKAVAYCINYEQIRTEAMYGYSPALQPGLILPFGSEEKFFSKEDMSEVGNLYDSAKAKKILSDAGYSWGTDGLLVDPSGKKIRTLYATCPKGWTDWEATIKIAVTAMRAIGIDVREKFVEYSVWDNSVKRGLFDFSMKTPQPEQAASLPWSRFEQIMTSKDYHPVGEVMYRNEGRYKNPVADKLLNEIPNTKDPEKLKSLYRELNKLFIKEMPVIPLMYRPWLFYQFNTKHWTNYPTDNNPYAAPQCLMVGAGVDALWGIAAVKK